LARPSPPSASQTLDAQAANARALIPSVDQTLRLPEVSALIDAHGRALVTDAVRSVQARMRTAVPQSPCDPAAMVTAIAAAVNAAAGPSLTPVFNLTGTVLHTNLGRASLPQEAIDAMILAASGPTNLEFDLETGERGDRDVHVEHWITRLTGAEAATVVNNNAAAVLLLLNTLAAGRQVPVSRGELIEIGGSFRIPDIMARAGCRLVEVGATNRTHRRDYVSAIGPDTALLMKVHCSNYEIQGFVHAVGEAELAEVAKAHGLPFAVDLGSGTLVDLERYGLPREPTPGEMVAKGADLVTFSGDKLLGGPQAGIIAGRADLIARIKQNPMKRAMRLDKVTIAALAAVLKLYADPDRLARRLPTLRLLTRGTDDIHASALRLQPAVQAVLVGRAEVTVGDCDSQIGSGSLPTKIVPSAGLSIRPAAAKGSGAALEALQAAFRALPTPVIGRIHDAAFWLDLRCLEDEDGFVAQLDRLADGAGAPP
jgi:L-seryl-tRNA(Ser) seleniumtransferase